MNNSEVEFLPVTEADLETIRKWRNSPEVSQYMYTNDYITEQQQQQWFNRISEDKTQQYWVISYLGKKIGLVGIYNINTRFKSCHWTFYLGELAERGLKTGSKVEFKLIDYVFNILGFNKLIGEVFSFNQKGIAMHEKFGFRREGYLRQHAFKDGAFHDVVAIALLKSEWDCLREYNYQRIFADTTHPKN